MDGHSEDSMTVDNYARRWTSKNIRSRCRCQLITFNILPDVVLLKIFDFYVDENVDEDIYGFGEPGIEEWEMLVHVCRRWRSVVFQSPRRLNLRLLCSHTTPARGTLDIWPPLPLVIQDSNGALDHRNGTSGVDNIIAALEHNDRVCQIKLRHLPGPDLDHVMDSAAMCKPFPELTDLWLNTYEGPGPMLTDSFLGGTAPRLRSLALYGVPFQGLPKLLLTTTHLCNLDLLYIPRSAYIPPEAMATSLSALANLEFLRLHFLYPRPRPALGNRRLPPPPLTRSILPSLTKIRFKGASEYLEEILARIDAPRLNEFHIIFSNQIIFDLPQLFQFISRRPTLRAPDKGRIEFSSDAIFVKFISQTSHYGVLSMKISCTETEWQLSSLEQICTSFLPPLSTLEDLYIFEVRGNSPRWQDDVENTPWLNILRSFVAVKNLYLSEDFVPRIAPALQELVGGEMIEMLSTLENIFLEQFQPSRPLHKGIEKFVAARRLTSHPVAVSRWVR